MRAYVNARVLLDAGFADDVAVLVEGEGIVDVVRAGDTRVAQAQRIDLRGNFLVPGFIDCQVNGGGGVLFNAAPTVDTIARIGAAHARYGTRGFLPTLISTDFATMRAAIAAIDAAIEQGVPGVLGIHLEGPFLAPERRGTHDAAHFVVPDAAAIELATSLRRGVTLITLAPERMPPATVAELVRRGALVSAGHSAANYAQARAALDAGVRGFTHLYNAMSPLTAREPGMVGAALEDRDSWCGLIVDGHHLHAASARIALAAKPRGKVFLVTDAMPTVGSDETRFLLDGRVVTLVDGRLVNPEGGLAGAALDMASALRNSVVMLGVSLEEAARMASTYPAQFLGLADRRGRIAPGCRADFVALDANLDIVPLEMPRA